MSKAFRANTRTVRKYLFVASILILPMLSFLFLYLIVNFNSFLLAFQKADFYGNLSFAGLKNFKEFFNGIKNDGYVWNTIVNSMKYWWINFLITMPLYLVFSYYVYKKFVGEKAFSIVVMLPSIVSTFIYTLVYMKFVQSPLQGLLAEIGVEDFPNIIDIRISTPKLMFINNVFFSCWISFGTSILVYSNAMRAIDHEVIESANLDGASDSKQFFYIVLPLIWPTITTFVVTGVATMFTGSGNLLIFYDSSAPAEIQGFSYYVTHTLKFSNGDQSGYPMVAASGLIISLMTMPVVFGTKWLMQKLDKTEE